MNIVQVTPRYPPQTGGVETHVQKVSEHLVKRGHRVTVIAADAGKEGFQEERKNGVYIRRYQSFNPASSVHVCPQVITAVRQSNFDIVHAHNYHSLPLLFAALGNDDTQLIMTPHYHGESSSPIRNLLLALYNPFGRWAIREADTVIAVSKWEHNQLAKDFNIDAEIIPNGLDVDGYANASTYDYKRPYILFVGRLEKYKGVQHLIDAMIEINDYDLLIVGTGPYKAELQKQAIKIGVTDCVKFFGHVPDEDLPAIYSGASVFATLSEHEAYGITVAEALAAGTPCLVREAKALTDWTKREDCIGISNINTFTINQGIKAAQALSAPSEPISTWEDMVSEIEYIYS